MFNSIFMVIYLFAILSILLKYFINKKTTIIYILSSSKIIFSIKYIFFDFTAINIFVLIIFLSNLSCKKIYLSYFGLILYNILNTYLAISIKTFIILFSIIIYLSTFLTRYLTYYLFFSE